MTYYQRIKQARELRGMTQAEMAKYFGTTQNQISKYESGAQEMTVTRFSIMCRILDVSADYILGLTPTNQPQPSQQYSLI